MEERGGRLREGYGGGRVGLEFEGGVYAYVGAVGDGGYLEVVFFGEGAGEDVGAAGTDGRTCEDVIPVVFFGETSPPRHVAREGISGSPESPSISSLQVTGCSERDGSMTGGERMAVGMIGAPFLDGIFENKSSGSSHGSGFDTLQEALPVLHNERANKRRSRESDGYNISGSSHTLLRRSSLKSCYIILRHNSRRRESEAQDRNYKK